MYRLIKWLKQEHVRQRKAETKLSGRCWRQSSTSEYGRSMSVMERLYERDQRYGERMDVLIRLTAALEDCGRQVGEKIFELVGHEPEEGQERGGTESDADSADTIELDFGSIGEDVLENTWFGWDE